MISIPWTHYHLGPGAFIGFLLFKWVDFPTLMIASVILDIEGITVLVFNLSYPVHGFFHSFLGATLTSIFLILIMKYLRKYFSPIMVVFKVEQDFTLKSISFGAFLGTFSHVFLDAIFHTDIHPFFPIIGNLLTIQSSFRRFYILAFCIFCTLGALLTYFIKLTVQLMKNKKIDKI